MQHFDVYSYCHVNCKVTISVRTAFDTIQYV